MARFKDPRYLLLGTIPTYADKDITGCRLPSRRQVLLCFIAHKEDIRGKDSTNSKKVLRRAANETAAIVKTFYDKARIPMLEPNKVSQEILKYYSDFQALLKISVNKRDKPGKQHDKITEFRNNINKTMKFWPRDALSRISNDEDRNFLLSMMSDRKATMDGIDKSLFQKEQRIEKRHQEEQRRREKEANEKVQRCKTVSTHIEEDYIESENSDEEEFLLSSKKSHRRCKKTGDDIHIPFNILKSEELVSTAVRNNITPTGLAATLHSLVKTCNGNPEKLNLNATQAYRSALLLLILSVLEVF